MVYYQGKNAAKMRARGEWPQVATLVSKKRTGMADNRVVIKINYDKDKQRKALIDPKMVTVWHTGRILTAGFILLILAVGLFYGFTSENADRNTLQSKDTNNAAELTEPQTPFEIKSESPKPLVAAQLSDARNVAVVKPSTIIFDKRVIRASINTAPKYDEPGEPIKQPVIASQNQAMELFYFSQIKNLKANTLFHAWYKDGQLVNKKQFEVKTDNARLISSRKLTLKDAGEWQVVLIDMKGKKFSEANFSVNH